MKSPPAASRGEVEGSELDKGDSAPWACDGWPLSSRRFAVCASENTKADCSELDGVFELLPEASSYEGVAWNNFAFDASGVSRDNGTAELTLMSSFIPRCP